MTDATSKHKVISIEKRRHRGQWQIFLHYDHKLHRDIDQEVRRLPNRRYSGSQKLWYLPYSRAAYADLKQLPYAIEVLRKQNEETHTTTTSVDTSNSGTTAEIRPKGENNGISKVNTSAKPQQAAINQPIEAKRTVSRVITKEQIVDSSTDQSETTNTPGISTTTWNAKGIEVTMNARWLTIKLVYDKPIVERIKQIKGAWWRAKSGTWMLKPLPENVEAIQSICSPFGKTDYERAYNLACSLSDPIVMEIYQTPEHPQMMAVKFRGYGVSTEFLKSLPNRNFDKIHKRWLIPLSDELVKRLLDHYSEQPGVTVKNRLGGLKGAKMQSLDYAKLQLHLVGKFPEEMREVLTLYTDALIRMRYSWKTVTQYTSKFGKYVSFLGKKAPIEADAKDANQHLSLLAKQRVSESMIHGAVNAIKYYYEKVIFAPNFELSQIKRPKKSHRLPTILSIEEVDRMMRSSKNLKHTAILYLLYSSGLRLNELLSLELKDIYWDRNQLFVRTGKGKKDRMVMLSETLKALLTLYFDKYQPKVYLFNGQDGESAYSSSSVQKIVKLAAHTAGIQRKVTPHTLRHCFATHLMESGTDVRYIQELLGHKDIKTTLIYTHVTNKSISQITSPLDALHLRDKNRN